MPIEYVVAVAAVIIGVFGFFIIRLINSYDQDHKETKTKLESVAAKQQVDDSQWSSQRDVNNKVSVNSEKIAVHTSEITNTQKSVDEMKDDIKSMNNKLDILISRKDV